MSTETSEGAPTLVIAKLVGDTTAPRPNITVNGEKLSVVTKSGALTRTETVECDSIYSATASSSDLFSDALLPIISAVLEGVNALVLISGNEEQSRQKLFDGDGENTSRQSCCVGFAAGTVFDLLERKKQSIAESLGGVADITSCFAATVYASYVGVADDRLLDALEQVGTAAALKPAEAQLDVVEDDIEGVYVRGLTTFGPVPSGDSLQDLLNLGHRCFGDKTKPALASGKTSALSSYTSRVIRITINQTIRLPSTPINSLRSHLLLVDVAGLETLSSVRAGNSPTGLESGAPTSTALAFRALSAALAESQALSVTPFSAATASRFGMIADKPSATKSSTGLGRESVDASMLIHFPQLAENPAMSMFGVSNLTKILSESLAGNCLTVAICTLAITGVAPDASMAVLDVMTSLRRSQSFPIVSSTSARGLLRQYRRTIRLLRASILELLSRAQDTPRSSAGQTAYTPVYKSTETRDADPVRRRERPMERNAVADVLKAARAELAGDSRDAQQFSPPTGRALPEAPCMDPEVALRYEERLVDMSRQLLESELENAVLRESMRADRRDIVVRLAELQKENAALASEQREIAADYDRVRQLSGDMEVELNSLQSNLRVKSKDARAAKERAAYLDQQVQMLQAQVRDLAARAVGSPVPGKEEVFLKQQSSFLQLCMKLRRRIAELTPDSSEFDRMTRTNIPLEVLLSDLPIEGSAPLPDSAFLESDGRPVPYSDITSRLHKTTQQVTRMRSALEQAAEHIRDCHDQIKVLKGDRPSSEESAEAEIAKLRSKVDAYKAHLVRARDALVAAKTARDGREAVTKQATSKEMETYRVELLKLQERCGSLSKENEDARHAMAAMAESMAIKEGDDSLVGRLQQNEKKIAKLLAENMDLQIALDSSRSANAAAIARYEKMLSSMRQDMDRTRSMLAQVTSAKAGLTSATMLP